MGFYHKFLAIYKTGIKCGLQTKMWKLSRDYYTDPSGYDLRCCKDSNNKININGIFQWYRGRSLIGLALTWYWGKLQEVRFNTYYTWSVAVFAPHTRIRWWCCGISIYYRKNRRNPWYRGDITDIEVLSLTIQFSSIHQDPRISISKGRWLFSNLHTCTK